MWPTPRTPIPFVPVIRMPAEARVLETKRRKRYYDKCKALGAGLNSMVNGLTNLVSESTLSLSPYKEMLCICIVDDKRLGREIKRKVVGVFLGVTGWVVQR